MYLQRYIHMFAITIWSKPFNAVLLRKEILWLTDTITYNCLNIIILSRLKQQLNSYSNKAAAKFNIN